MPALRERYTARLSRITDPELRQEFAALQRSIPYATVIDARDYGVAGNGAKDDTAAIQRALDAADDMDGGIVYLPVGTYGISDTITVPNRVVLRGSGRDIGPGSDRGTIIKALSTFPTSTHLVQLADDSAQAFGCRVEELCIHCSAIAGSTGVKSEVAQERSGLFRVTVRGYMSKGVDFTDQTSTIFNGNFLLEDVELFCDSTATGTTGFYWLSKNASFGTLFRVSINGKNNSVDQTAAIHVANGGSGIGKGNLLVLGANLERHTDGILIGADTYVTAVKVGGYAGQGGGSSVIRFEAGARGVLIGCAKNSTFTNTVKDDAAGVTVTDATVGFYAQGQMTTFVPYVTLTDAASTVIDASLSEVFKVTLGGNRTMASPSNAKNGKRITITVIQDGTGGRTLAWNAVFKVSWSDTGNVANARSSISFVYDGTNWNQDGAQTPYV